MIFVGDIATGNKECCSALYNSIFECRDIFSENYTIANLEGMIDEVCHQTIHPILNNHPDVMNTLKLMNVKALTLANNHSLDLPENFNQTKNELSKNGILFFGVGKEDNEAILPAIFEIDGIKYIIFGYCWNILMQHQKDQRGSICISKIKERTILNNIKKYRDANSSAKIAMIMHWNFDLETLPFPLHRVFSRAMIDVGADIVIGHHSHCVQGGERYKGKVIIYGLGNFFFPWYVFTKGNSFFPKWTSPELVVDWNPITDQVTCHWFNYEYLEGKHDLIYVDSEDFDEGETIKKYSPYRNLGKKSYYNFFKKNRRKKTFMPIYSDHNQCIKNFLIDKYVILRIKIARFLLQNNYRKREK